ncbi:hypothetical protein LQ772_05945 [Frateuria edaphi]|jgi:hypothetical protein|uniref:hypothetical protein n=1 Tax=Frateuria edaphi TaxID=2898793 RepID=UPI001E4021E1|nr:hypothetical protein [Frateuria edaphi]UGB46831.1 hypothetical protein LQ772_05920 [Frateuria edaphi]UGB46835.1 hypothetical protein LQ772_05945 [Frateuria edaphi]
MKHIALTLMTLALLSTVAYADTPLPPPHAETVCSPSKRICATTDPAENTTVARNQATQRLLWSLAGWHRWLFVADDGISAVVGYDGQNLLPLDAPLSQPVLGFYRKGGLVRVVTLGELYKQLTDIPRTASHLAWVSSVGFNKHNQFELTLPDGRHITFSLLGQRTRAAANGT